jgi:hypothetical protein
MGENDRIVTRYMADQGFQASAFPRRVQAEHLAEGVASGILTPRKRLLEKSIDVGVNYYAVGKCSAHRPSWSSPRIFG